MAKSMCCFNSQECTTSISYIGGIPVCDYHIEQIRFFTDDTIQRQNKDYKPITRDGKTLQSYKEDIQDRLDFVEKDYLKTKIKLLHILEQL